MRLKMLFWVIWAIGLTYQLSAQSITPAIINCTGGYAEGTYGSLTYSIGETAITTLDAGTLILTQGVLQPNGGTVNTTVLQQADYNVYPNPTTTGFWIETNRTDFQTIQIWDATGKCLKSINFTTNSIDLQAYPSGSYFVRIYNAEQQPITAFKILKTE